MPWPDVRKAVAFKRDQFVVDMLCLAFELPGPTTLEVNEEMPGWRELVDTLPQYLPGAAQFPEWFAKVAFPAFKLNATTIYERAPLD